MKNIITCLFLLSLVNLVSCAQNNAVKMNKPNTTSNEKLKLSEQEWKAKLSPEQYYILREKGTESPFSGEFVFTKEKGTYKCAGCGEALFTDDMKFESNCGWPSFDKEIAGGKIIQSNDNSHGMNRTEITCAKCGGHLGHIFDDGPTETGKRYCVNSGSLSFEAIDKKLPSAKLESITLAGGCFWCIEAIYEELKGVISAESGYAGGTIKNPSYKQVCSGNTGHAEAVQVKFDPTIISLEEILEVFFTLHDPTSLNRQGADEGTQYRSAIFYETEKQKEIVERTIHLLSTNKAFESPIVTEVSAFTNFYKAENFHQEYYELNKEQPYCKAVILPKMEKLHKLFSSKIKASRP
jgi:peptide methionine sulfoxide reductase msrA/msrB